MEDKDKLFQEIKLLCNEKKYNDAIKLAKNGFKKCKDECFLNEIAEIYIKQKDRKGAIKYYKEIYKKSPNNVSNIKKIAYNLFVTQNFKEAAKYYKEVLNFEPNVSENYFNVASMYHFMKKNAEATSYYNFAIKLNPKNISAINNLGALYYETGNYKEAMPYFKSAIKISPNHPEAYHHIGVILRDFYKDFEMSKWYLKKALRIDPNYPLNSYQIGLTYKKLNDKENAKLAFEKCLKIMPSHKEAKKELKNL